LQSIEREVVNLSRERRKDLMLLMREQGATYEEIGFRFGLSRQRVAIIIGKVKRGRWGIQSSRNEQA